MKKHLFLILFLFAKSSAFSQTANNEEAKTAKVFIIGVNHTPDENRNTDSLLLILNKIKPNLILAEADTLSYFNKDYTLRNTPTWYVIGSKLNLVRKIAPEMDVLYKHFKNDALVDIKPYDIAIPNRIRYIQVSKKKEISWVNNLNLAASNNELPKELEVMYEVYVKYNNWFFEAAQKGYFQLNQKAVTDSVRQMFKNEEVFFQKLIDSVSRLNKYKSWREEDSAYWKLRNETMSKNILKFIKSTKAEKIVVFTGLLHKYYLIDLLNEAKKEYNFELKEFYETN